MSPRGLLIDMRGIVSIKHSRLLYQEAPFSTTTQPSPFHVNDRLGNQVTHQVRSPRCPYVSFAYKAD